MRAQMAYLPLATYSESASDDSIVATVGFAASLGSGLHVTTFGVAVPPMTSPFGTFLLDVPELIHMTEERSKAECLRLQDVVQKAAAAEIKLEVSSRQVMLGAMLDAAATEARSYDVALIPWSSEVRSVQDVAEAVVFGSGRPTILVPPKATLAPIDHITIAWDASPVAARALWDALALVPDDCRVTVLTIRDEKPLSGPDLAGSLAAQLEKRGYKAGPVDVALGERTIASALQESALEAGAQLLAMGGFGHSRLRDFILGGATHGVLTDLRLPVLLSH